ncbi:IclR family transcriptional regulator [Saccharopolyspora indica]|uniref:IclR family transcriptional regulator n=1 Tax=Saccharopolyspora indica TaxID=1229659 RepID=UPI0022EA7383|nr:IclR family transcriptional regulator [Saccharopolyspora indica]MDA3646315.1 IclR family transcriptional regulator [Saccharopolyspora indica]
MELDTQSSQPYSAADADGPRRVQSVTRAFAILEAVAQHRDGARLSEIAQVVGLSRSTTHNLLATLESLGYLDQPSRGGRYVLTEQLTELARGGDTGDDALRGLLHPTLERLAEESRETCYLAVPTLHDFRYLDAVESSQPLKLGVSPGTREPLLGTAIGHILLGFRPGTAERVAARYPQEWDRHKEAVAVAREQGYALDVEVYRPDLCCVAVPVSQGGRVRAAVGIAGPAGRLPEARLHELAALAAGVIAELRLA